MSETRDYGTTRSVAVLVSFIGWCVIALGTITVAVGLAGMDRGGLMILGPGIGIAVGGLLLVAQGQLLRAFLDTASNTRELVELMRRGNVSSDEKSVVSPHENPVFPRRIGGETDRPEHGIQPLPDSDSEIEIYKNRRIFRYVSGYPAVRHKDGSIQEFYATDLARRYIDESGDAVPPVDA